MDVTLTFISLFTLTLTPVCECGGVLSLVRPVYHVREGDQVTLDVLKMGTAASPINIVLQITDPSSHGGADFLSTSHAAVFPAGVGDVERSVSFTTRDDQLPEKDEVFTVNLRVTNGDGRVDENASKAHLVIAANDDAFGVFGFVDTTPVFAAEVPDTDNLVSFQLHRKGGHFGEVLVEYQIFGEDRSAEPDISPVFGNVSFYEGERVKPLNVFVKADDVPEDNEKFQVVLTSVWGGLSVLPVSNRPALIVTEDSVMLTVRSNDAPVNFVQALYRVDEDILPTTLEVKVARTHVFPTDGPSSGPIHTSARLSYYTQPTTATPDLDYTDFNGTLLFEPGSTEEVIHLTILPDIIPELSESFEIVLEVLDGDIVLIGPYRVTVTISDNDDPNGVFSFNGNSSAIDSRDGALHLDEDSGVLSAEMQVVRRGGAFGEVTIDWELTERGGEVLSSSSISPKGGQLVFRDTEREKRITLVIEENELPGPAHKYRMSLLSDTLQGGGRVSGLTSLAVVVEDSDDVHGVILFAEQGHTIITDTSPRKLALTFVRNGGTIGHVSVQYLVKYSGAANSTDVVFTEVLPALTQFTPGQTSQTVYTGIRDDVFLRESSAFTATTLQVTLVDSVDVGPFHSPSVGHRAVVEVSVSPDIANGEVGLDLIHDLFVEEPDEEALGATTVYIPVKRIGFNGHVTVYWTVTGSGLTADHVTNTDVQPMAGSLTMVSGQSTANIVLSILPDDEAETTEEMTLTLTHVEPNDLQRLSPGRQALTIYIQENDNPGGVFQLSSDTPSHVIVQEEVDPVEVHVVRVGGALVTREVEVYIDSENGEEEFYGARTLLKFYPGDTHKTVTLLARADGVPELSEHFQLKLQGFGETPVYIGSPSSLNITVLENEQPFGVFVFSNDSHFYTGESKDNEIESAHLLVHRAMGRFGSASVDWRISEQNASQDVYPLSGRLEFQPGEGDKYIVINTVPDEIPEDEEIFTVLLYNATGGARISEENSTNLVISRNDDAIYFSVATNVRVSEGSSATFTLHRDGSLDSPTSVKVRTVDGTAVARALDYVTLETDVIEFSRGEMEHSVTVTTLQDEEPETDEVFYLELYDAQGDVSVFTSPRARVTIAANDKANGVFSFSKITTPGSSTPVRGEEGMQVEIGIEREAGHFSTVYVHWQIFPNDSSQPLTAGEDFEVTEGNVTFHDLQAMAYLNLIPVDDELPEFDEVFRVVLNNVSGGGPGSESPHLASSHTELLLVVVENDAPWGLFSFTEESRDVRVAEDYMAGQESTATVSLEVERRQGTAGHVKVAWEVFSHQVAGGGNLPGFVSILCVGEPGTGLVTEPDSARPQTQTLVYRFDGCADCIVSVASQHVPPAADVANGFALSAWIRSRVQPGIAYILAKSSEVGDRLLYGLRLQRKESGVSGWITRLQFVYHTEDAQGEQLVQSDDLGAELDDNDWHHILLNVDYGEATFYLDGQTIGLSTLVSYSVSDGPGVMYAGGLSQGTNAYTGHMQDVRMFTRKLNQGEIHELYSTPARLDLAQISGYLSFPDGESTQRLQLTTQDDQEEEAQEVFSVRLISASGGAQLAQEYSMAIVRVLKSDNANGLFGFSGPCEVVPVGLSLEENSTYSCPIQREKGDAGEVTVTWQVLGADHYFNTDSNQLKTLAEDDFVNATGTVDFLAGEREKSALIRLHDDRLPELGEEFVVELVSAESGEGGSTPTSGASIDGSRGHLNITAPPSDQPYGLLQLTESLPQSDLVLGYIQPMEKQTKVMVREEQGTVTLYVVRSQGVEGQVTVEWRTREGTAKSNNKIPPDFMASVGELTFQAGEVVQPIQVTLVDNEVPEAAKEFEVELLNPGGGAEVGFGGTATVHIQHSDFAHGWFMFATESLQVSATEHDGLVTTGVMVAEFKIVREGGSLGPVSLFWSVSVNQTSDHLSSTVAPTDPNLDLSTVEGTILFEPGQLDAVISVGIRDDTEPELDEVFVVELVNVSQGTLGQVRTTAELTVEASDDPYGKFVIASAEGPTYVEEANQALEVSIMRSSTSGHYGTVLVDYTTVHPSQLVPHLSGGQSRADYTDFNHTQGSLVFAPGQTSAHFILPILEDELPEMEESVFVRLTSVQILEPQQTRPVTDSPSLGDEASLYGEIIIMQNDDPHGVLDLTASKVTVTEDQRDSFVSVVRTRGDFGSISVEMQVIQGSATSGLDFSVTVSSIHFSAGETEREVPVSIIDDSLPELEETFTIRLLDDISGGARLGLVTECLVTIEMSDDPYGAFVFEREEVTVREPASGEKQTVSVSVLRLGGTLGVVTLDWTTYNNGDQRVDDISPSSGQLYFVSNEAHQYLTVDVIHDEQPEPMETILIQLTSATNGGRIVEGRDTFSLHISSNDNPHGTVEFLHQGEYVVFEPQAESLQYVPVNRTGGTEGELRVYYSVQETDLLQQATRTGENVLEYFYSPESGKPLTQMGTRLNVENQPNPLQACAEFCLVSEGCDAFDFLPDDADCNWYSEAAGTELDIATGHKFYTKDMSKTDPLYTHQAKMLQDFTTTKEQTILIADGQATGFIPVQVTPDNLPELPETFIIHLFHVELIGAAPEDPENLPKLGSQSQLYVTIAANDDANGVFRIYSNSPQALKDGQEVEVEERESLSVEFIVERMGGGIGEVGVSWRVVPERTTASRGSDFIADGATLSFQEGELYRAITVAVEDDILPEDDETVVIELYSPTGGAELGQPAHNQAILVIMANDHVAGLLGFTTISHLAREGDHLTLQLWRSLPALGELTVTWEVQAVMGSDPPEERFRHYAGTLYYSSQEEQKQILLYVLVDNQPKIDQEYRVVITHILTEGVRQTGAAGVDPVSGTATITIEGGNEPHGVFVFNSLERRVTEIDGIVDLPIDRKFGSIGSVRIHYTVQHGSITPVGNIVEAATPEVDFDAEVGHVTMYHGETSASIPVWILEDDEPEIDEVFIVTITSVELVTHGNSSYSPRVGFANTMEVIISANDGTQGEVLFPEQYANMTVSEGRQQLALVVRRTKGTFGAVSVFCFAQNTREGAVRGEDFSFDPMDLHFGPGVSEQLITVTILEDEQPEPDEAFEIVLASPKQGLQIGVPGKAVITILASDEASGVVSFDSPQNVTIVEPAADSQAGSTAYITLIRAPGAFGVVRVPFTVESTDQMPVTDITPTEGVVIFKDKQDTVVLELRAVSDDIPEEVESFTVVLGTPGGGARLGLYSRKMIMIDRNDAPYGQLTIHSSEASTGVLTVEEGVGVVYLDVVREQGSLGWVSVELHTEADTARHQQGEGIHTADIQQVDIPERCDRWYTFEANKRFYALLLSDTPNTEPELAASGTSPLYIWQGALVKSQDLPSDGGLSSACVFTSVGVTYLFTTSLSLEGEQAATSRLYRVEDDAMLSLIQEFPVEGASSSLFYTHNAASYLMVHGLTGSLTGETQGLTRVYVWEPVASHFSTTPVQVIETREVRDSELVVIAGETYLVVASYYDHEAQTYEISSVVYKLDSNGLWTIHQFIPTKGAVSVTSCTEPGETYIIIGSSRDDAGDYTQNVDVYQWNTAVERLQHIQSIETVDAQSVETFTYNTNTFLTISAVGSHSGVYSLNTGSMKFTLTLSHPHGHSLHPLVVPGAGALVKVTEVFLLSTEIDNGQEVKTGHLYQLYSMADESDYIPRSSRLTFAPGQTRLRVGVSVYNDHTPEGGERFGVGLHNPRGGAELGGDNRLTVHILSNDDGHGIVEFDESSRSLYTEELPTGDVTVMLSVVRRRGLSGHLLVSWIVTGEHNGDYDLSPQQGQVEFADGQSVSTISLTVKDDGIPELDETSLISLTEVLQTGSDRQDRGAIIGDHPVCSLTVLSSDSPHGVVRWDRLEHVTEEPTAGRSARVALTLERTQGTMGDIRVMYMTQGSDAKPPSHLAESGSDYVALQGSVDMDAGVTKATVTIVILDDSEAELSESFLVNITSVQLLGGGLSTTAVPPTVSQPHRLARVTIRENDNARGIVSFKVDRNTESRVDTYEGSRHPLSLPVVRGVGVYGDLEVTWRTFPREATLTDFSPSGGTLRFEDGQKEAVINITVVDDDLPEVLETFEVRLTQVTSGGGSLGADSVVRVGIVKNDSPNGVFSFTQTEVSVLESQYGSDPDGLVSVVIHREGTDGEVTVHWRLDAQAVNDFLKPLAGSVRFGPGESTHTISLRTQPDDILEGEERFNVSLVSVTNNADLSPDRASVTLLIQADPGAGGQVSVSEESRQVYTGEPGAGGDGMVVVRINRGPGMFGDVDVTWMIVQPDSSAFTQTQGVVTIPDGEKKATITLQTKDDSLAEPRRNYRLVLTSATGGATISEYYQQSRIIYVASDYPHGLFEFQSASEVLVNEEATKVAVTVRRRFGSHGEVLVTYTTDAGTARDDVTGRRDFLPSAGVLRFGDSVTTQQVFVQIVDDTEPEGPEYLFVNITRVQLVSPVINSSVVSGHQLDMPPSVGPVSSQKVVIIKNDNAEGMVQFAEEANNVIAYEHLGVVSVPLSRVQGYWGEVEVHYTVHNGTAMWGRDYIVSQYSTVMRDGERMGHINVTILNDRDREMEETFRIQLTQVTGGGTLGSRRLVTVIIAKSDYPNGKLSFLQPIRRELENPESVQVIPVTVERSEGLIGRQTLKWRIMGPNSVNRLLSETSDVSSLDPEGQEVTQGSLTWEDGESGPKYFSLQVKPHSGWEVEETFVVVVYDLVSFPAEVGSAEMDPTAATFTVTVLKFGDPNGIVRLSGVSEVHRHVEEPLVGSLQLLFPITRRVGAQGDIQVLWTLETSPINTNAVNSTQDVDPASGEVHLLSGQTEGLISVNVLADQVPEMDETFTLVLTGARGGAEIDPNYNSSQFTIRYNDHPHGRFGLVSELQTVVVTPASLQRQLRLNMTRRAGHVGRVKVNFELVYDQARSGVSYIPPRSSVTFNHSQSEAIAYINIEPQVFLAVYSSFTVTLTEVIYLGDDVTQDPEVIGELSVAKVMVPEIAANSQVGFEHSVVSANETTGIAQVSIYRSGTYGTVTAQWKASLSDVHEGFSLATGIAQVSIYRSGTYGTVTAQWKASLSDVHEGFSLGTMLPESSTITLQHGVERETLYLQLYPDPSSQAELFRLELSGSPASSVGGGARLLPGKTDCVIEPHGVVRFQPDSRQVVVEEPQQGTRQVTLQISRLYGSDGDIQLLYSTVSGTAVSGEDFTGTEQGALTMSSTQTAAYIYIQVNSDSQPEVDEVFHVTITSVTSLSSHTTVSALSPRISELYGTATVTIRSNNNPYGVVYIETATIQPVSEPGSVELIVRRSGGSFGEVLVQLRTVGGGESWDGLVASSPQTGEEADTVGQVLASRESISKARVGQDYQVLDTTLLFKDGESMKTSTLYILDDTTPEGEETVLVYLIPQTEGVGVARPTEQAARKGYTSVVIQRNDFWSGWVGFYGDNSSMVTGDEDSGQPISLTVERRNATFGAVQIEWRAVVDKETSLVTSPLLDLSQELQIVSGSANCPALSALCTFTVHLRQDSIPENETAFWVELTGVSDGADIDPSRRFSRVQMLPSDHPNGMVQFAEDSRHIVISKETDHVTLNVNRRGYLSKTVRVGYETAFISDEGLVSENQMVVSSAIPHSDYEPTSGQLVFTPQQNLQAIRVELDLRTASLGTYPKAFYVELGGQVTGLVEVGVSRALVVIADREDLEVWRVWAMGQKQDMSQQQLQSLLSHLMNVVSSPLTSKDISTVEAVLDKVLNQAETLLLTEGIKQTLMDVLCSLLDPDLHPSSLGQWQLSQYMERFAELYLRQQYPCEDCCSPEGELLRSPQCQYASFSVAKWPAQYINGYQYTGPNGDHLTLPGDLIEEFELDEKPGTEQQECHDVVFVEYSTQQWFVMDINKDEFLNQRIFTLIVDEHKKSGLIAEPVQFRVHAASSGVAVRKAECVYFNDDAEEWTSGDGVCQVTNNLALAIDDYVECSCKHLSNYAVRSRDRDPSQKGYPLWFYIICTISITALTIVIINHHVCSSVQTMFTINLLMHFCFALIGAELCYLIDAYFSPNHILDDVSPDSSNHRCIIMSLFTHYFFLAQFTWMLTLGLNFHRILVLNDEHTRRKYVQFALIGWGVPALIVFIFYAVTYVVYRFLTSLDPDQIYGDVHSNGDLCFVSNVYAGLAGVVLPCVICLSVIGIILLQAFQITPQWQAYDDIYKGSHNIKEVRLVLLYLSCVLLQWVWAALHLAFPHVWLLVLYCVFCLATGIIGLVVYAIIRNPCMPCYKLHKTDSSEADTTDQHPFKTTLRDGRDSIDNSVSSITGSKASLISSQQNWQNHQVTRSTEIPVRRKPGNPVIDRTGYEVGGAYVVNPAPFPSLSPPMSGSHSYSSHSSTVMSAQPVADINRVASSTDLDELIFALDGGRGDFVGGGSDTSRQDTERRGAYDFQAVREAHRMGGGGSLSRSRSILDTQL